MKAQYSYSVMNIKIKKCRQNIKKKGDKKVDTLQLYKPAIHQSKRQCLSNE